MTKAAGAMTRPMLRGLARPSLTGMLALWDCLIAPARCRPCLAVRATLLCFLLVCTKGVSKL